MARSTANLETCAMKSPITGSWMNWAQFQDLWQWRAIDRQRAKERAHFETVAWSIQRCNITSLSRSCFLSLTRFGLINAMRVVRVKLLVQSSPVHSLSACLSAQRSSLRLGLERQRRSQTNWSQIRLTTLSACLRRKINKALIVQKSRLSQIKPRTTR